MTATDIWGFVIVSIPTMIILGLRHALDSDHIIAIDNLVRLHNATKKTRWVGTGFSVGHLASVLAEMILIIYIMGNITGADIFPFWGGLIGAVTLAIIGAVNIYSMKRWGKTGSAILASKILDRTGVLGPFGSALVTGLVFGLGFDTATQISAITLSAIASVTLGVQAALILTGFFAIGMIPIDTLDSVVLRSAFSRIFGTKGFRYISYALSAMTMTVAVASSYKVISGSDILPDITGPLFAGLIILISFVYALAASKGKRNVISKNSLFIENHERHDPAYIHDMYFTRRENRD